MAKLPFSPVFPLGVCRVVTPGTPVNIIDAAATQYTSAPPLGFLGLAAAMKGANAGVWPAKVNKILFQAIGSAVLTGVTLGGAAGAGNTGPVYIGLKAMVKATGFGVITALGKPAASAINFYEWINNTSENLYRLEDFYIDADTAGDGVLVTAWVV